MDLITLSWDSLEINFSINLILLIIIVMVVILLKNGYLDSIVNMLFERFKVKNYVIDEVRLGIGKSSISFKPNHDDRKIAYKLWVELSTRKLGLPIDLEEDVIVEVYNSWYAFFGVARELLKEFPISKLDNNNDKDLIEITLELLNDVLRDHLTTWQAKYRKWYSEELKKPNNLGLSPQEIQKNFGNFNELSRSLLEINENLDYYRSVLYAIAHDKEL